MLHFWLVIMRILNSEPLSYVRGFTDRKKRVLLHERQFEVQESCASLASYRFQHKSGVIRIRFEKHSLHAFEECSTFVLTMTKICIYRFSRCFRLHLDPNGGVKGGFRQVLIRCPACFRAVKMNFRILRSPCALCTVICNK